MASKLAAISFTWGASDLMDRFTDDLWQALVDRSTQKVRRDGRGLITEDDLRSCLREALDEVAARGLEATHVGG